MTPQGTTIDLFDYWVFERDSNDFGNWNNWSINDPNSGINANHDFDFATGSDVYVNTWRGLPTTGIVENLLGNNGYPMLASKPDIGINTPESLAYLFDTDVTHGGKASYNNVSGLLQVDDNGYFYYDSTKNFASFDTSTNDFTVYDTPAVQTNEPDLSSNGQFFPFNTASDVFEVEENGQLVEKGIKAKSNDVNHWFGMTMTTRFIQTKDGLTTDGKNDPVTYHFSGDDDVWVYIDGVLVGDLGGMHSKADLDIDFSTGVVTVTGVDNGGTKHTVLSSTLREIFREAGQEGSDANWKGNTFADETLHSLKFFYLERGSADSNLSLQFNLVTVPESEIVKVDQSGQGIKDAYFELYEADADHGVIDEKNPLAQGYTDEDGRMTLVDAHDALISFSDLYKKTGSQHYILREKSAPSGYRLSGDIYIEYSPDSGVVYNTNYWETGAYANASEAITAPMTMLTQESGGQTGTLITNTDLSLTYEGNNQNITSGGTLFAVVLYRDDPSASISNANGWRAIYGQSMSEDGKDGWKLSESTALNYAGVIEAAKAGGAHVFGTSTTNGMLQANIGELPGNIQNYFWVSGDQAQTDYIVSFYYTSASSWDEMTSSNVILVQNFGKQSTQYETYGFRRQFAAKFNVPDMYNRLIVQKVDDKGNLINGAQFGLYTVNPDEDPDAQPIKTKWTQDLNRTEHGIKLTGSNFFEGADGLVPGTDADGNTVGRKFWVKEIQAPTGYKVNDTTIEVYVDGTGVYANAGNAVDGVNVRRGAGMLSKTMAQFATDDELDTTLHDIVLTLQTGDPYTGVWNDVTGEDGQEVHLSYGSDGSALDYGPTEGGERAVWSETGWPLARITQCYQHGGDPEPTNKTDLQAYFNKAAGSSEDVAYNLRALFSGTVTVRVANQQVNDLEVSKDVDGYSGMSSSDLAALRSAQEFEFTLTLDIPENVSSATDTYALVDADGNTIDVTDHAGNPVEIKKGKNQVVFTLKDGQTARIEDLPTGTTYTVTEAASDIFDSKATSVTDEDASVSNLQIAGDLQDTDGNANNGNNAVSLRYTNTYKPKPTSLAAGSIQAKKVLDDKSSKRGWKDGDTYLFWLVHLDKLEGDEQPVLPEKTADMTSGTTPGGYPYVGIKVTDENVVSFGEITFTEPGTYEYLVRERRSTDNVETPYTPIPGISYSEATYSVIVTVTDNLDGTMSTSMEMKQTTDDSGVQILDGEVLSPAVATFTNVYAESSDDWSIAGSKNYTDNTGSGQIADRMFRFIVTPGSADTPIPENAEKVPNAEDRSYYVYNTAGFISFGDVHYNNNDHGGKTYTYTVREDDTYVSGQAPTDAMTFDDSMWTVAVTVIAGDTAEDPLTINATYAKDGDEIGTNEIVFNNSYEAAALETTLKGVKYLNGWTRSENKAFEFTVSGADQATRAAITAGTVTIGKTTAGVEDADESGTAFDFGTVTFTKEGAYTFAISEKTPATDSDGMTWDRHVTTATVQVTDNGGKLVGTPVYDNTSSSYDAAKTEKSKAIFVNEYAASGTATIDGWKIMEGRTFLSTDDFSFAVSAEPETSPMPSNVADGTYEPQDGYTQGTSKRALGFGEITFTEPGTYTYTFAEDGGSIANVTYSTVKHVLKLVVSDNGKGTLSVTDAELNREKIDDSSNDPGFNAAGLEWTNVYAPNSIDKTFTELGVTKSLVGRSWKDGEQFYFTLAGGNARTIAALESGEVKLSNNEVTETIFASEDSPSAAFGAITFTKGTKRGEPYEFVVTETDAQGNKLTDGNGMTYDAHAYRVYIGVHDDGAGTLTPEVRSTSGGSAFTNTYGSTTSVATTDVTLTKEFNGWNANDAFDDMSFGFTIARVTEGAPMPTVTEATASHPDEGTTASFSFGPFTFTNEDMDGATVNTDTGVLTKQFVYTISENVPDDDDGNAVQSKGITYDTHDARLTITVTDDGKGTMTAGAVIEGGAFENTYSSSLNYSAMGDLAIVKTLTGRDMTENQFKFTVTPQATEDGSGNVITSARDAAEKFNLPLDGKEFGSPAALAGEKSAPIDITGTEDVVFTQADAGKTYTYTIQEQGTDGGGYDYDTAVRTVTIAVEDNGDATLTVTTTVKVEGQPDSEAKVFTYATGGTNEPAAVVSFENKYSASTNDDTAAKIEGTKTLTGRDMTDGEFSFQVIDAKNKQVVDAKGVEITGTSAAASDGQPGAITFKPIHFDTDYLKTAVKNDIAKKNVVDGKDVYSFPYTVSEVTSGLGDKDITPNDYLFIVTVKVTDNGDGTLTSAVDYSPYTSLDFTNTYGEAKVTLSGSKVLKVLSGNNAPDIAGKFTFTLTAADGTPMPEGNGNVATNDASGNVKFGEISYELSDMGDATEKTFTYTVTESGSVAGVENDSDLTREITVKVTKGVDGKLSATVNDGATGPAFAFTFTNTYSVKEEPSSLTGDGNFTLTKVLKGRPMAAGEFKFALYDASGTEVANGTNDANGNVEMSDVPFKEPNTYTYKLIEINENAAGGVTYDKASYTVTATVTDKGDGTLGVEWSAKRADGTEVAKTEPIVFTNTYEAKGATVGLGAAKLLNGGKPADGQFTFQVLDASGKVVAEAKNDEYGSVQFPELDEFTAADVYTYTIVEVDDGQAGVKYDTTEFGVKVTVSETDENGNYTGSLHATVEYLNGVPVFENTYKEPEKPVTPADPTDPSKPSKPGGGSSLPTTGESAWAPIAVAALVVGVGAIAVALRMRKHS